MKSLIAILAIVGSTLLASAASAADCGRVTIANMNWQSAEVLANIDKIVLSEGYGCEVELIPGDTMPTLTSMIEKGEPDVTPEAWVNAIREPLDRAVNEGNLVYASQSLPDGGVLGWWIPNYLAEANPEIKTFADALKHPELFPAPEDASKGAVHTCPAGWACQITVDNLFKANKGTEKGFTLVDTGSAAGLDGSIAKAYERKEGWLGYYWAPTGILGKYDMVRLTDDAPFDSAEWDKCTRVLDCPDPKVNGWPTAEVYTVVTKSFADRAGPAVDYLKTRSWPNSTVNKLLAWMSNNQATGEEGAVYFLKNNEDVWTKWLSPDAAEKVRSAL